MAAQRRINAFRPARRKVPKPSQEPLRLQVDGLSHEGRGIARRDNKIVFVDGALAGEEVEAILTRQHRRYDEARMERCLVPAENRVEPFCKVYERCGGCQLQHLDIEAQRRHKLQRLAEAVAEPERFSHAELECLAGPSRGYRHRARLSYRGGSLGFKARASHDIVEFPTCPVLNDSLNRALDNCRGHLLDYLQHAGPCELELASGERGEVGLAITQGTHPSPRRCQALADVLSPDIQLHRVSGAETVWHGGAGALQYPLPLGPGLAFRAGDFTQVNPCVNALILHRVGNWLSPVAGETVVDYFCGLGNFSRHLAALGARVIGFDLGTAMISRAREAAALGDLGVDFQVADLFDAGQLQLPRQARKVILDPPRAGAKALCEYLARQPQLHTVVYVSCEPATLGRDLEILRAGGLRVASVLAADMFPHSRHLESLVLLQRR